MTTPNAAEDPAAVVKAALDLLEKFVKSPQPFAISNSSLEALIQEFGRRLIEQQRKGTALKTIAAWSARLDAVRSAALTSAKTTQFADGGSIRLLTEDDARKIATMCPPPPL